MKSRQRLSVTQTQQLSLTTGLLASIRMLRTDAAGLTRYLEEHAAENPYLALERPVVTDWLPRWTGVLEFGGDRSMEERDEGPAPSLIAHVMAEIDRLFPGGRARQIAIVLAEALEPSGWLGASVAALAAEASATEAEVTAVLHRLQGIEPAGLFATNLAECLRLQAREAGVLDKTFGLMLDHLDLLAKGEFGRLAKICEVPEADILQRLRDIRAMDPKPGAQFAQGAAPVREPDLIAKRGAKAWEVALNRSALPAVRLDRPDKAVRDPASKVAWSAAQSVARMVAARNATLLAVGVEVMRRQVAALERGLGAVRPLTMGDVAVALDLHESTVSRIVAGTSIDTPLGTWWLRGLFSGSMGGDVSAATLRDRLARLVAGEDPARPLSDEALARALSQGGAEIARRTVAKYREGLNIPPAFRRKALVGAANAARQRSATDT
jgi:RNA polymerase sigma-54 factor